MFCSACVRSTPCRCPSCRWPPWCRPCCTLCPATPTPPPPGCGSWTPPTPPSTWTPRPARCSPSLTGCRGQTSHTTSSSRGSNKVIWLSGLLMRCDSGHIAVLQRPQCRGRWRWQLHQDYCLGQRGCQRSQGDLSLLNGHDNIFVFKNI